MKPPVLIVGAGDYIRFEEIEKSTKSLTGRDILVRVEDIISAPTFELLSMLLTYRDIIALGDLKLEDMRKYYTAEDELKFGVVAIKFEAIYDSHRKAAKLATCRKE